MAKKTEKNDVDDITSDLIDAINKEMGVMTAYNLAKADAPTVVKRWIDTGSIQLNYAIRNAIGGGYPEGRIIEISGLPSTGKSHLAYHAASVVQAMGGLCVYIDCENATMLQLLGQMGIDIKKRFVFVDEHSTEGVFKVIESVITKAKSVLAKDVPILVVWDSIAASSPLAELQGDYDQNTVGLQARVLSKGFRKLVGVIGHNNVTLLCLNQLRTAIGVMHGDPYTSPGGKALPFFSSVRVRLGSGNPVKDKSGNVIGSHVTVTVKKNKVAPPHRKCMFDIIFGKGIVEHEYLFDEVRSHCADNGSVKHDGKLINVSGDGAWKLLTVSDAETGEVLHEKKFYKSDFGEVMRDPVFGPFVMQAIDAALTVTFGEPTANDTDDIDDVEEVA